MQHHFQYLVSSATLVQILLHQRYAMTMSSPEVDNQEYRYASLSGRFSIRILHLNPGCGDEAVSCIIETVDLRDEPKYEALSYEWGSIEKNETVFVDWIYTLNITRSLHDALRDIRHEDATMGSRTIWADALSINQENIEEREQQVNIMGDIYRSATGVLTYIGPEADNSALGIEFAYELLQYWGRHVHQAPDPRLHTAAEIVDLGLPSSDHPKWEALRKLITRGWVGRCWCAQEFVLNKNCMMICGRRPFKDVSTLPLIVTLVFERCLPSFTLPSTSEDPNSLRECLTSFQGMRRAHIEERRAFGLLSLLEMCHNLKATDPRDKVYSLLGLAMDSEALSIRADYTFTVTELYTRVATAIMNFYHSTHILYSNLTIKSHNLPSWVPDWSSWRFGSGGMITPGWYRASGDTTPNLRIEMPQKLLHISGCLVDRVFGLNDVVGADYLKAEYLEQRKWLEKQSDLLNTLESYTDGSPLPEVLWRSLIANLTFNEETPGEDYMEYFRAFQTSDIHSSTVIPWRGSIGML